MGVSKNSDTTKWSGNGRRYWNGGFGGTPIFGNTHTYDVWSIYNEKWHSGTRCSKVENKPLEDGIFCAKWGYFIYLITSHVSFLECISTIQMNVKKTSKFFRLEALCWWESESKKSKQMWQWTQSNFLPKVKTTSKPTRILKLRVVALYLADSVHHLQRYGK